MSRIELDESLITGDPLVDHQHAGIFELFNDLCELPQDTRDEAVVASLIARLHSYAIEHFAAEQELMVAAMLPAKEMLDHFEQHRDCTARVRQLVLDYRVGRLESAGPVVALLQDWFTDHIRQRDRELVRHIRESGVDVHRELGHLASVDGD